MSDSRLGTQAPATLHLPPAPHLSATPVPIMSHRRSRTFNLLYSGVLMITERRQDRNSELWSGIKGMKGKKSESCSVMSDSLRSHGLYSPWNSPGQNTGVGSLCRAKPRIEPRSPTLQADSSPAEPQGKPKNTGVGSLSLLQWTFPVQELNQGLLHWRRILYQLSYQGSL